MPHNVLIRPVFEAIMRAYPRGAIVVYGRDCRYLSAGGKGLIEVGLVPEDMVGRSPTEVFGPELGPTVRHQYERCLQGWDGTEEAEYGGRIYEVIQHPVRIGYGDIVAGITISVDITEAREMEREKRALEAKYHAVLDHFPGAVFLMGADSMHHLVAGTALPDMGLEPETMVGHTLPQNAESAGLPEIMEHFQRALSGERVVSDVDIGEGVFNTRWNRIGDVAGMGEGVVCVAVDVTEQRRAAAQVQASLSHAGALLREVHHRVKNNLQVVHSLLSVTARRVDSEEARASLRDVRDRVFAMSVVHTLLYQSDDLGSVRLDEYFRKLVYELMKGLPELGTVEVVLELDRIEASAEVSLNLGLILTELVSNAAKHGVAGGRGTQLGIRLQERSGQVSLSVWDDGPGPPNDVLQASGPGMGLWVVRTLAKPLGAQLELDRDAGARWTVTMDRAALPA